MEDQWAENKLVPSKRHDTIPSWESPLSKPAQVRPLSLLATAVLTVALFTGCSGQHVKEAATRPVNLVEKRPSYCLAISGGGIRSGAVSLGALQGLYSKNELAKFEFVSVVSGGGYAVYGLLDQMIRKDVALADLLSETGEHVARVEKESGFIGTSDIYSAAILGPTLWSPLSWFTRAYGAGLPTYTAKIHGTFAGGLIPLWGLPKLASATGIRTKGFPTPIFGTSASVGVGPPLSGYKYTFRDFFELSTTVAGAPSIGYFSSLSKSMEIVDAVAMSAAAIDTPQGDAQLPAIAKAWNLGLGGAFYAPTDTGNNVYFYLADGGFIENLGLLPLLRRGCNQILAFDNSEDDDRPFDPWFNFESRLTSEEGWTVSKKLRSTNGGKLPTQGSERWRLQDHIWDALLVRGDDSVRLRLVKLGINRDKLSDYPGSVQEFAKRDWAGNEPGCRGAGLGRHCSFPLEATGRQSFGKDEFRAYRHLGKWLAELALRAAPATFE